MNDVTHFIFSIYNYNLMIKDTLEYTISDRKDLKVAIYQQRKNTLKGMLDQPSPVRHFLDQNGETGKKIESNLREFIEDVYGDDSTILHVSGEELRVDHAQHLAIYNFVVGLHETFNDILHGYLKFAKDQGKDDPKLTSMIDKDDDMFRVIAYMTIFHDVEKSFIEFNQAMTETHGQPSPQSNFVLNDLKQYIGFLSFVNAHYKGQDTDMLHMMNQVKHVFALMEGKEKLPEGKKLSEVFEETKKEIQMMMGKTEQAWRQDFMMVYPDVVAYEKEHFAKENPTEEPKDESEDKAETDYKN